MAAVSCEVRVFRANGEIRVLRAGRARSRSSQPPLLIFHMPAWTLWLRMPRNQSG